MADLDLVGLDELRLLLLLLLHVVATYATYRRQLLVHLLTHRLEVLDADALLGFEYARYCNMSGKRTVSICDDDTWHCWYMYVVEIYIGFSTYRHW